MSGHKESILREPLITGNDITYAKITNDILLPVENKPNKAWWIGFILSLCGATLWVVAVSYTFWFGIGEWGLNKTVGWAWDITGFVWWVGIGHAGTLISAVLLLFRQNWRNSINRSAEAMTIFAVICAATYVVSHMGRPWLAYWVLPLPNQFGSLWVNFNSPLVWDMFAISTYFSVSLLFWYTGLLPDIASIRDRATGMRRKVYSIFSFGWTGNVKTWQRFEAVSLILAGISTPLVLSVHTIVSMDFATSVIPGWHTTIFPPYFVAGAIFSGFAMVLTLLLVARKVLGLENYITMFHIESMNKIIILTGSIVGVAYLTEFFIAWYSGSEYEQYAFINRSTGPYWWAYWMMMTCNVISPQLLWFKKIRTSIPATWILSIVVNIGMWFERFVIIVTSLHRDYIPSSWAMFYPTWVDVSVFVGSIGLFFTLFLLFLRVLPSIAIAEVKLLLKSASEQAKLEQIKEGHLDKEQVTEYVESLEKFDSVKQEQYAKNITMSNIKYILGSFGDPDEMMHGIEKLQEQNISIYDVYTPMPIHGIEAKLGVKRSRLDILAFFCGITGTASAFALIYLTSVVDWKHNIGGKPSLALPDFIPIMFELTILFTAFSLVGAYYASTHLFPGRAPRVMDLRATDDRFIIAIDAQQNAEHTVIDGLLKDAGALEVKYNERKYISYE